MRALMDAHGSLVKVWSIFVEIHNVETYLSSPRYRKFKR